MLLLVFVQSEAKGRGGWPSTRIKLQPVTNDPEQIRWQEYGRPSYVFYCKFGFSIIVIFATIPILDAFAYSPNIRHLLYYHDVPLMNEGYLLNGMICGALCGALNVIISKLIEKMMYFSGFISQSRCERWYLMLYFLAILINTIVDLTTYIISALGYASVSFNDFDDPTQATKARISLYLSIADKPGVQHKVFSMIMNALPATLICGALAEPIGIWLLPLLVNSRLVQVNNKGTVEDQKRYAEQILLCDRFDERRSADIMVSVVLCTLMLAFTQHDLYMVFGYLFFFQVITYSWDHYRLLRCCTSTTFTSFSITKGACLFLCTPCALMAALLVGRIYHVAGVSLQEQYERYLHKTVFDHASVKMAHAWVPQDVTKYFYSMVFTAPAAFVAHWLLHVLVMRVALRRFQTTKRKQINQSTADMLASPTLTPAQGGEEHRIDPTADDKAVTLDEYIAAHKEDGFDDEKLKAEWQELTPEDHFDVEMQPTFTVRTPAATKFQRDLVLVNYFNANPVHCLRSKYIFDEDDPICPIEPGKEYLLYPTWNQKVKALRKKKHAEFGKNFFTPQQFFAKATAPWSRQTSASTPEPDMSMQSSNTQLSPSSRRQLPTRAKAPKTTFF